MAEFRVSLVSAVGPAGPGGPIYPDEDVTVTVLVVQTAQGKVKAPRFEVACPGWTSPKSVESKDDAVRFVRRFAAGGAHELTLTAKARCVVGNTPRLTVDVHPYPTLTVEVPDAVAHPTNRGEHKSGDVELRAVLSEPAPAKGAEAVLESPSLKHGRADVSVPAGMTEAVVRARLVPDGFEHPLTVRAKRRCQAGDAPPPRVKPVLPVATLAWADPSKAGARWPGGPGDGSPELEVTLDYPAPDELKVYVAGEPVVERGGWTRGKERSARFLLAKGRDRLAQQVELDPEVRAGRYPLRLVTRHEDGAQPSRAQEDLQVELAPRPRLSFPERWCAPEGKDHHVGDEVTITVALDRPADATGQVGELVLTPKGGTVVRRPLEVQQGTQEARVTLQLADHDPKTKVTLEPDEAHAAAGDPAERALAVHQANQVTLGKLKDKRKIFHPGDAVEVPVELKYALDGKGQGEVVVAKLQAVAGEGALEPDAPVDVVVAAGAKRGTATITLAARGSGATGPARFELVPEARFRGKGTAPERLELPFSDKREVRYADAPRLDGHPDVGEPFYRGEPVRVTLELSAPLGPGATLPATVGTLQVVEGSATVAAAEAPVVVTDPDQVEVQVVVTLPAPAQRQQGQPAPQAGALKLRLAFDQAQAAGFEGATSAKAKKRSKKQPKPGELLLDVVPAPALEVADPPWKTPPGGAAPAPESDGAYARTTGERAVLLLRAAADARVPLAGLGGDVKLVRGHPPEQAAPPVETLAAGVRLEFDAWKRGQPHAEVEVAFARATLPAGVDPTTGQARPLLADEVVVTKAGARGAPKGGGAGLSVRVTSEATFGFAAGDGWWARQGDTSGKRVTLHPGDVATLTLALSGGPPRAPHVAPPGPASPVDPGDAPLADRDQLCLLVTSVPGGAIVPLDDQGQERPVSPTAHGFWVPVWRRGEPWTGRTVTFDARLARRATSVSVALAPTAPPHAPGQPAPPKAPQSPFTAKAGEATRQVSMGAGKTIELVPHAEGGPLLRPDRPWYLPEDEVTLRFRLDGAPPAAKPNDDGTPGEVVVGRLESTAFGQHLLMPVEVDEQGRQVLDAFGKPKRLERTKETQHLGTPATDPLTGRALPAYVDLVLPPEGDPAQGEFWDPATGEFTRTVALHRKPLVPAGEEERERVHELVLVDAPKSEFTPGQRARAGLRARPAVLVRLADEQPDLPAGTPVPQPAPAPGQPAPAPVPTYQTVALAEHTVLLELTDPPPPAGVELVLHASCFPVDPEEEQKLHAKAEATVDARQAAARRLRHAFHRTAQLEAARYAATEAARIRRVAIPGDAFAKARDGVLRVPVRLRFQAGKAAHAAHVVATTTARDALPRTDGLLCFVWSTATAPGSPPQTPPPDPPGTWYQYRKPSATALGAWQALADLDEGRAYQPKTRPPVTLTLRAKSGARTDPPLGQAVHVRVATGAAAFPPRDTWWQRPEAWADEQAWSPAQRAHVLRKTAFYAAGDRLLVRVQRAPTEEVDDPDSLDEPTRARVFPAFPADPTDPLQATVWLTSTAFERPPAGTDPGAALQAPQRASARVPVTWAEGQDLSEPVAVTLKPVRAQAPKKKQKGKQKGKRTLMAEIGGAVVVTSPTVPLARPGQAPQTGPPLVVVVEAPGGPLAPELARRLGLVAVGGTSDAWEEQDAVTALGQGQPSTGRVRVERRADLSGGTAGVRVVVGGTTAPPAPTGTGPGAAAAAPSWVRFVTSEVELKQAKGAALACAAPAGDQTAQDAAWQVIAREVVLAAGVRSTYKAAPGASRALAVTEARRLYFVAYKGKGGKVEQVRRFFYRAGKSVDALVSGHEKKPGDHAPELRAVIDDEVTLDVACSPCAVVPVRARLQSPLLGETPEGVLRDVVVRFEPGESLKQATLKLTTPPATDEDARLHLVVPWGPPGLALGRHPGLKSWRLDKVGRQLVSGVPGTDKVKESRRVPLEEVGLLVRLEVPEVRIAGLRTDDPKPKLLARLRERLARKLAGRTLEHVLGQGERFELQVELSHPAREGTRLWIASDALGTNMLDRVVEVAFPAGETRATYTLEAGGERPGAVVPLDVPLDLEVVPAGSSILCRPHRDEKHRITVVVAGLPVVNFPWLEHPVEDDGVVAPPGGVPTLRTVEPVTGEAPKGTASPRAWITPAGPFAVGDRAVVTVELTAQVPPDGVARLDLVSDAFDRRYPIELTEGQRAAEVEVVFERTGAGDGVQGSGKSSGDVVVELVPASGCLRGRRARRTVKVYARRTAYFPPRMCLAPGGPFVAGDAATVTVRVQPPAPRGGAAFTITGPFDAGYPLELPEGGSVTSQQVRFSREADSPQAIELEPRRGCGTGEHARFQATVKTPAVSFAPAPVQPAGLIQVHRTVQVVLTLSHPAPGERPWDPDTEAPPDKKQKDAPFRGTEVTVACAAFVPERQVVRFVPGERAGTATFRVKPDAAGLEAQDHTLTLEDPVRCAPGDRATATVTVRPAPLVRFAGRWIAPAAATPLEPGAEPPGPDAPPGEGVTNAQGELVFKEGDAAVVYLEASEHPAGEARVLLKSPAFGPRVYVVDLPRLKRGEKREAKRRGEAQKALPFAVRVTLARGYAPGDDGLTPLHRQPVQLFPPAGWQIDPNDARREVHVVTPGLAQPCPLGSRPPDAPEGVLNPPAPGEVSFDEPCALDHVLVVEYHGLLADGPTRPGWKVQGEQRQQDQDTMRAQRAPQDDETTRAQHERRRAYGEATTASELVATQRGPFHLVRDPTRARAAGAKDDQILIYRPGDEDGVPVLEVTAGPYAPPPDPGGEPPQGEDPPPDPRHHRTHLSLQVKRGRFCASAFEEIRPIPRSDRLLALIAALQAPGQALPELPTDFTLSRHHPLVNVRSRWECALACLGLGPLGKNKTFQKFFGRWKHLFPPVPDVRRNASAQDDPQGRVIAVALGLEDQQQYDEDMEALALAPVDPNAPPEPPPEAPPGSDGPVPGEDETTLEGWATLATLSLFPAKQAWDYLRPLGVALPDLLFQVDPVLPPALLAGLPPVAGLGLIGTAYDGLRGAEGVVVEGINALGEGFGALGEWFNGAVASIDTFTEGLQPGTSGTVDTSQGFDLATFSLAGVPLTLLIHLFSFVAMKPREYELEVQTCGVPDLAHPNRAGPCDGLRLRVRVYPSAELSLVFAFKPESNRVTAGADGTHVAATGETTEARDTGSSSSAGAMVPNPDFDPEQAPSDENQEFVESGAHRTPIDTTGTVHEQRTERDQVGPQRARSGPDEAVGEGDWTLPDRIADPSEDPLALARYHAIERGFEPPAPEQGWHGGSKPGAPEGWRPALEAGEKHGKSRIFHPIERPGVMDPPVRDETKPHQALLDFLAAERQHKEDDRVKIEGRASLGLTGIPLALGDAAQSVQETLARILGLLEGLKPENWSLSFGFSVRVEAAFLEGQFVIYWGWKEHESRWVFPWWAGELDLVLAAVRFQVDFGARLACRLLHFEAIVYLRASLDATLKGGFQLDLDALHDVRRDLERQGKSPKLVDYLKAKPADWLDTWICVPARVELGAKLVLVHENFLEVGAAIRTGLELRWRLAFGLADRLGFEWELYFLGVTAEVTFGFLGGGRVLKTWRVIEGNPDGLPWKRGALPGRAGRSFWNARKAVKNAWNKLLYQRRRILAVLDAWQALQLTMVAASTRREQDGTPVYPYTSVVPGFTYVGEDDDDARATWEHNRARWDLQWRECKAAFPAEALTNVSHRKKLWKRLRLEDVLTDRAARAEKIVEQDLLPRLARLERVAEQILALDRRIDTEEQYADERAQPTKELLRDCLRLEQEDEELNWKQRVGKQPLTDLTRHTRSLGHYAAQRVAW